MAASGDVQISIVDSGAGSVIVPASSVQVVLGCTSIGTVGQVVATRSPATLQSTFGYGPAVEAAALSCLAGGTVLFVKTTTLTPGSAGTVTRSGTGTSVVTVSGTPVDTYYVKFLCVVGGTIATAGITFQISLDAGRNYGPVIALGTANTYAIPNTGITLNFGVGTMVAGDSITFGTTEPVWNTAGVQAALNALQASPYAITGWGSMHIVGAMGGANATTIQGYLDTLATGYIFTRAIASARDASPATIWSGTGETDATWSAAIQTDYSATAARRLSVSSGHYNMPSAYPNQNAFGAPRYRRPLSWAIAARRVQVPPQRHSGRVRDGALSNIVVDPVNDPLDGFVYHDERINPGLDVARFMSARTRTGYQSYYVTNDNLMSPVGSDFSLLPLGNVMDVACQIVHQVGQTYINDDLRTNPNGTVYEADAKSIENAILNALNIAMASQKMISNVAVVLDRTVNLQLTKQLSITVTIYPRGYVQGISATIGFNNPLIAH